MPSITLVIPPGNLSIFVLTALLLSVFNLDFQSAVGAAAAGAASESDELEQPSIASNEIATSNKVPPNKRNLPLLIYYISCEKLA